MEPPPQKGSYTGGAYFCKYAVISSLVLGGVSLRLRARQRAISFWAVVITSCSLSGSQDTKPLTVCSVLPFFSTVIILPMISNKRCLSLSCFASVGNLSG